MRVDRRVFTYVLVRREQSCMRVDKREFSQLSCPGQTRTRVDKQEFV